MNKAFPFSQCKAMALEDFHTMQKDRYGMEAKIDGWRLQIDVSVDGCQAWTRTNHSATGKLPLAEGLLQDAAFAHGSFTIDGEVVYLDPEGIPDFNFTSRAMGSGAQVCRDKQIESDRFLSFVAFDLLRHRDEDLRALPFGERRVRLEPLLEGLDRHAFVVPLYEPSVEQHLTNIDDYGEGSVLKDYNAPYMGKRNKAWLKWKKEETVDVTIIGYTEGQGKYAKLIGAIRFIAPDGTTGNCSGMDDATRVFISDHREMLLSTKIEVKHYGMLVDGYRHPQFLRFRPDK